jgi:ubiquitin C-terminal hydrolase
MSISLPLSKEIGKAAPNDNSDSNNTDTVTTTDPITVERCLKHFTLPEQLADPVDCPSCGEKTPTTKQHVISRLPKILVLHLKRFDAAANRKIEEFVSFPAHGLNMGPYLPHWSEISQIPNNSTASTGTDNESPTGGTSDTAPPIIHYSLQSTVNHFGSLQSGHYYANVKISNQWYHCNDAHVSYAEESEVLAQEGAYMLVYARQ